MTILGEMRAEDHLTIVSFATNVTVWDAGDSVILQATPGNIRWVIIMHDINIKHSTLKALLARKYISVTFKWKIEDKKKNYDNTFLP